MVEVRVANNAAPANGGGLLISSGSATILRCLFDGNQAHTLPGATGGAVWSGPGATGVLIEHTTFSGNTAARDVGGAISDEGTEPVTLRYVTLIGNSSGVNQGGTGEVTIVSSILTGNGTNECTGFPTSGGYNLFGSSGVDGGCPIGATDLVPSQTPNLILDVLANNGGPTDTHGLYFGSPAIDFVPLLENGCGSAIDDVDQRAAPRSDVGFCAAGAYEGVAVPVELVSFSIE